MARPPGPQLLHFLEAFDRPVAGLALALREMVLEEAPDAVEKVYRTHAVAVWFGFDGRMKHDFCYIAVASRHVNLGFPYGAMLADPSRVLEGEGIRMRHIKFRSEHDLERPFIRRYLHAAMEHAAIEQAASAELPAVKKISRKKVPTLKQR